MGERSFFVCRVLLMLFAVSGEIARAEGRYQSTRDGKTLVWNNNPKPGDVAAWSGGRDRNDYGRGFGGLRWYTTEPGTDQPQLFARYWGRMVDGKFEGPVNVHSKKKTFYAIFIEGDRVTKWQPGAAPTSASGRWRTLVAAQQNRNIPARETPEREPSQPNEPEAPAAGPATEILRAPRPDLRRDAPPGGNESPETRESIQDLYGDRWPKIDIDDSIRILAFPPRRLRR